MSSDNKTIFGALGVLGKEILFGQYMAMLRNFEGNSQADIAQSIGYSRACLSKFETGDKSHELGFYRSLQKVYLDCLKVPEGYILKLLNKSSSLFRFFTKHAKRYSSIFLIASRRLIVRDNHLVRECRRCMLDVLDYLLVRGFFKYYGLKLQHIGMIFAHNIKNYKYRKAPAKRKLFKESFEQARLREPVLNNFKPECIWTYYNNKRSLCCKKLEETLMLIHRKGLI